MKILVTGGAGFIGSHLLERLLELRHEAAVFDDFNDYYDPSIKRRNLEAARARGVFPVFGGDVRDAAALGQAFDRFKPDAVVHLAARAGVRPSIDDPALYASVNILGTATLLEECRRRGVRKFVFASSSSVYGDADAVPFREDNPALRPISPYGATKLAGEHYCSMYHKLHGLRITALRFFTAYGPRQRPDMAIHKFAALILKGKEIQFLGDGSTRRDYTYVDDVVQGVVGAIDRYDGFESYNLGESRTVTLSELVSILERALGTRALLNRLPPAPGDVQTTFADISKARANLGYAPRVPIEEGVRRFCAWMKNTS